MASSREAASTPSLTLKKVLRDRQRARIKISCLPCRERKVRCDGRRPCQTCVRREHTDLCINDDWHSSPDRRSSSVTTAPIVVGPAHRDVSDNPHNQQPSLSQNQAAPTAASPSTTTHTPLYEGSTLARLTRRSCLTGNGDENSRCSALEAAALPLLGVANSGLAGRPDSAQSSSSYLGAPLKLQHQEIQEIMSLFMHYKTRVHPYQPVIEDLADFEKQLCAVLVDSSPKDFVSELEQSQFACLVYAVSATGAQFSDMIGSVRAQVAQRYIKQAMALLATCNFMTRPSVMILQAFLVLSQALQNSGQPQEAWVLGGSMYRIALALGALPQAKSAYMVCSQVAPEPLRTARLAIIWQDSLLALAFGIPPSTQDLVIDDDLPALEGSGAHLDYRQSMYWLHRITLKHNIPVWSRVPDPTESQVESFLEFMHSLNQFVHPHLQEQARCSSFQDLVEHYSWILHYNSVVSAFMRPILSPNLASSFGTSTLRSLMMQRLRTSLKSSVRAFIHLRTIASNATRSWAAVHNGLTSGLLLSFMKETRTEKESLEIQSDLIQSLSGGESSAQRGTSSVAGDCGQLTEVHAKCLKALMVLRDLAEAELSRPQVEESSQPQQKNDQTTGEASSHAWDDFLLDFDSFDIDEMLRTCDFGTPLPIEAFDRITSMSGNLQ